MTTIAWDGTTLAVDKQATTSAQFRYATTKLHVFDPLGSVRLFTSCGDQGLNKTVAAWLRAGMPKETKPVVENDRQFTGTLIELIAGAPRVTMITKYLEMIECPDKIYTDGSGHEYAIMALHLGKDAVNAVWHTMQFDVSTGIGIDWARLDGSQGTIMLERAPRPETFRTGTADLAFGNPEGCICRFNHPSDPMCPVQR